MIILYTPLYKNINLYHSLKVLIHEYQIFYYLLKEAIQYIFILGFFKDFLLQE